MKFLSLPSPCGLAASKAWPVCILLSLWMTAHAWSVDLAPRQAAAISGAARFDQNLGAQIPLDTIFRDEDGSPVALRSLLGERPAILVLGYHECPMLCSLVLGGVVETLTEMRQTTGKDFDLIDVSISPQDSPAAAARQKRIYFKRYARHGAESGWHFLTSPLAANVHALSDAVGFHYAYDPASGQYAHPSGLIILTPDGKVSRYFFGVTYDAGEVQAALRAASRRQVSSPIAELLLVCFHFNPLTGRYGPLILDGLRAAGVLTLIFMAGGIYLLARRRPANAPV